jgi:hypothetical protein
MNLMMLLFPFDLQRICRFDVLMRIIESYVQHPILLTMLHKALPRTETRGGNFYEYQDHGIPKGSPLSPLLGAIALIPLDKAIGQIQGVFMNVLSRFMSPRQATEMSLAVLRETLTIEIFLSTPLMSQHQ